MYSFAKERGIEKISLLSKEEVIELENNINIDVKQGLYSEDVAVVSLMNFQFHMQKLQQIMELILGLKKR